MNVMWNSIVDRLLFQFVKTVETLHLSRFCIVVPIGHRFDLLASVKSALRASFPRRHVFVVSCECGPVQGTRTAPTRLLYMPMIGETADIPTSIRANSVRASAEEGLRLRCTTRACPLRPPSELPPEHQSAVEKEELAPDDVEVDDMADNAMDVQEEGADEAQDLDGSKRDYLVDLFPFSRPIAHYYTIL